MRESPVTDAKRLLLLASDTNVLNAPTLIFAVNVKVKVFMIIILSSKLRFLKELRSMNLSELLKEDASKSEIRRMMKDLNQSLMQLLNSLKYLKSSPNLVLILKLPNKLLFNMLVTSTLPVLKPLKKWHKKMNIQKKKKKRNHANLIGKDIAEEEVSEEEEVDVEEVEILLDKCSSNSSME